MKFKVHDWNHSIELINYLSNNYYTWGYVFAPGAFVFKCADIIGKMAMFIAAPTVYQNGPAIPVCNKIPCTN